LRPVRCQTCHSPCLNGTPAPGARRSGGPGRARGTKRKMV
jgi:hypothetical protein